MDINSHIVLCIYVRKHKCTILRLHIISIQNHLLDKVHFYIFLKFILLNKLKWIASWNNHILKRTSSLYTEPSILGNTHVINEILDCA